MLSVEDYRIIQKLERNPLMPYTEFASELGISWPTAKKRVNELKIRGVIRTPVAIYSNELLGLRRMSFIWTLESRKDLSFMEKFCDIHPYTHYRCRGYGRGFILFTQFDVPPEVIPQMNELSTLLQEERYVRDITTLESSGARLETFPDLQYFDLDAREWVFDWNEWLSLILQQSETLTSKTSTPSLSLDEWDPIDFQILRNLTANAETKQADLMREFDLSRTETHRRYSKVFENLISSVRLSYNRILFDLVNTHLFWVRHPDKAQLHRFFNLMGSSPPPFRMGLDILKQDGFFLWAGAVPSIHEHHLAFSLWQLFGTFETYTLDTSIGNSMLYWFYPNNFDFDTHYWRTDREYTIDQPLKELNAHISSQPHDKQP
ncbi:MAG: winged helix-turn-helix transcriptional regulator [Promethearchaeota archaeon]